MRQQQSSKSPATIKPTSSAATSAAAVEVPGQLNRHQGSNFTTAADWAAASSISVCRKAGTEKLDSRHR